MPYYELMLGVRQEVLEQLGTPSLTFSPMSRLYTLQRQSRASWGDGFLQNCETLDLYGKYQGQHSEMDDIRIGDSVRALSLA